MTLKPITRSSRRQALLTSTAVAYADWRHECVAVGSAYRRWRAASRASEPFAFHQYELALIREGQAADVYARMVKRGGRLSDVSLVLQLEQIEAGPER
jgi:hypothetical protein